MGLSEAGPGQHATGPLKAYIALGSNLGNSLGILGQALAQLQQFSVTPLSISSFWRSEPIDCPPGSPPFINAAVELTPAAGETPRTLLARLQALERTFGRRPKILMNEPRPLDLDLIAFGTQTESSMELTLPHPRAHLRRFVLAPLAEIAPDLVLPGQLKSVQELLQELRTAQAITRIDHG